MSHFVCDDDHNDLCFDAFAASVETLNSSSSSCSRSAPGGPIIIEDDVMEGKSGTTNKTGARNWVITVNNPCFNPEIFNDILEGKQINIRYLCWCLEEGENKVPHIQGFLNTGESYKKQTMVNKFRSNDLKGWIDIAHNPEGARDYILRLEKFKDKQGLLAGPWKCGDFKKEPGTRTELKSACKDWLSGYTKKQMAEKHAPVVVKFHKGLEVLKSWGGGYKQRSEKPTVIFYIGYPGSGKSYKARRECEKLGNYYEVTLKEKSLDKQWWQDYDGEETILINEFNGQWSIEYLKNFLDEGRFTVENKNGSFPCLAKNIFITSNQHWKQWYSHAFKKNENDIEAIRRRITHCYIFTGMWKKGNVTITEEKETSEEAVANFNTSVVNENIPLIKITEDEQNYLENFEPSERAAELKRYRNRTEEEIYLDDE